MDVRLRALNRYGLGARVGERADITDPRGWLSAQLDEYRPSPIGGPNVEEIGGLLARFGEAQRARDQDRLAELRRELRDLQVEAARDLLTVRVRSEAPFVERLVAFWSNHLCVSAPSKRQVAALAGHYERAVVRPRVLGRFEDLVLASAKHPAMLFYLDNFQSVGPGSPMGLRSARRGNGRGLNENYARELLELHTVGVDGGYAQDDVEALARVLTGWSVSGANVPGGQPGIVGFVFRRAMHEPGAKRVMGRRYAEAGEQEGDRVIRDLCAHPSTARFVAAKLVRHFVSDEPPESAVETVAATFRETEGDLLEVSKALIDLDEAWRPEHRKFRTPQDWLVAVLRALKADDAPQSVLPLLRQLRHAPWSPSAPKGYGDLQREWTDPDALMNRAELARTLASRVAANGRFDPRRMLDVVDVERGDTLETLLADRSIQRAERLALAIGGPAFQWR